MVRAILFVALALVASVAFAQEVQIDDDDMASRMAASPYPCKGKAKYRVEIKYNWSSRTHPDAYPADGHLSPLTVASHNKWYNIWAPFSFASKGVQNVAEMGNNKQLLTELSYSRNVFDYEYDMYPTEDGTEIVYLDVYAKGYGGRTLISAISMLAPSPDWFTGIDNIDMCDYKTGKWYNKKEGNLSVWDAGTDAGMEFLSDDKPQKKQKPIMSILGSRFNGVPVGTYKIYQIADKCKL